MGIPHGDRMGSQMDGGRSGDISSCNPDQCLASLQAEPVRRSAGLHWLHRLGAGLGLVYLGWILIRVRKIHRPTDEQRLLQIAALAYVLNIALGAVHVFTEVSSGAVVTAHLMGSSLVWATLVATTARSRTAMDVS